MNFDVFFYFYPIFKNDIGQKSPGSGPWSPESNDDILAFPGYFWRLSCFKIVRKIHTSSAECSWILNGSRRIFSFSVLFSLFFAKCSDIFEMILRYFWNIFRNIVFSPCRKSSRVFFRSSVYFPSTRLDSRYFWKNISVFLLKGRELAPLSFFKPKITF